MLFFLFPLRNLIDPEYCYCYSTGMELLSDSTYAIIIAVNTKVFDSLTFLKEDPTKYFSWR